MTNMLIIWVTGLPGSGKSTLCKHLAARVPTQDADEDGFTYRRSLLDGSRAPKDTKTDWDTQEWVLDRAKVQAWRDRPEPVGYLFGSVSNEDEVWDLFDGFVFMDAPIDVLTERLCNRTSNGLGQSTP